jgi:hypothetical protein
MQNFSRSPAEVVSPAKLAELLAGASDFELLQVCRDAVATGEYWREADTGPLPWTHVLEIYTRRAELNKEMGLGIKGYEELLAQLRTIPEQPIRICCMVTKSGEFLLFCDDELKQLFGILGTKNRIVSEYLGSD